MVLTGKELFGGIKPSRNSGRELLFFRRLLEIIVAVNFLAVQDSSIGDIVSPSVINSEDF